MSFAKARDLLRLAQMAAARHEGVSLAEIADAFGVDHRTAQRMARALEDVFERVEIRTDGDRRRRWRLADPGLSRFEGVRDSELSAIDMSVLSARREGRELDARALLRLRDRLLAEMPGPHARRAEADAEAVLEAQGYAARPGPRVRTAPGVSETVAEALKGPFLLEIRYRGRRESEAAPRVVAPHGLLLGLRRYLVARQEDRGPELRHFRLDRIASARLIGQSFAREPDFDIAAHAARAFGSFHAPAQEDEVVWRFAPGAAEAAREFEFHPTQEIAEEPDGSLTVRFRACGWLEMAWHLYMWGDAVEVLAPEPLRRMVEGHRRSDFEALP
jgi:predicted DNA-binding transcriptional regulator YafY